jgi:tetratricopeptide (TPR) repeat protein
MAMDRGRLRKKKYAPANVGRALVLAGALLAAWVATAEAAERCTPAFGRVVSVQGNVEIQPAGAGWQATALNATLCAGDMVRVHQRSRAALLLSNETTLRLDQGTTLMLVAPGDKNTTMLEQISGGLHVITRTPKAFKVKTPFVNANVEGTEFAVRVTPGDASIAVYEGRVIADNDVGSVALASGEEAVGTKTAAPTKKIVVRPMDAVAWALYVPTLFDYRLEAGTAGSSPAQVARQRSIALYRGGQLIDALAALDNVADSAADAHFLTYRAGLLLVVGRLDEAKPEIDKALLVDPNDSDAHALLAIVAVVENDKDRALEHARRAIGLEPTSPAARIALSYAQQARFELEPALASVREAITLDPQSALARARAAELEMSTGNLEGALAAAQEAVRLNPALGRTQTVLGFANLVRINTLAAKVSFERAIELDTADPLPRLGLGLAKIREGDLVSGRVEIEIAAILDPLNSLIRSYLGKAYFEEGRNALVATQFDFAKERDALDPTPYYYDAIRKQSENRPVEALRDLEKSIELNGNRAVYRSRLRLDEDAAARSAHQARVYADLGFDQLAVAEAVKSLARDPASSSAHAFLADHYVTLPRHEMARDSELLQAQLLQPLTLNPVQPRLSGLGLTFIDHVSFARPGAGEYGQLLNSQGLRYLVDLAAGSRSNYASSAVLTGLGESTAFSIGHFALGSDGFRPNNDQKLSVTSAFLQLATSAETSTQVELRSVLKKLGDTAITFFDEDNFEPTARNDLRSDSLRLGLRHALSPRSLLLASYFYRRQKDTLAVPTFEAKFRTDERAQLLELQHIYQAASFSSSAGVGVLSGDLTNTDVVAQDPATVWKANLKHLNVYLYQIWHPSAAFATNAGISWDHYEDGRIDRTQANPKFGVLWTPSERTTMRVAAFRSLKRRVVTGQTIEPTGIFGFNQYFSGIDDLNGADARALGVALTHRILPRLSFASEWSLRKLKLFAAQIGSDEDATLSESPLLARLFWTPADSLAISAGLESYLLKAPAGAIAPSLLLRSRTTSLPLEVRYFDRSGFFSALKSTSLHQSGSFFDFATGEYAPGKSSGTFVNASLGYRLPRRAGLISVEVTNLFDRTMQLQEVNPQNSTVSRRRSFAFKANVLF